MIASLTVNNVALIERAEVTFGAGLNILSGETGAGKSILIDAIKFLLGGRVAKDFVRGDFADVSGIIRIANTAVIATLAELGVEAETGEELLINRTLNAQGRSLCRINGRQVTNRVLKEVAAFLVDIHSQHEHQSLLNSARHIDLLDQFCGAELERLKAELAELIADYREILKEIREIEGAPGQREAQLEIWEFQMREIKAANLKLEEEDELTIKRNRLSAADKLHKNANEALFRLNGGNFDTNSATDQIGKALTLVMDLAKWDESQKNLEERLREVAIQLADISEELGTYTKDLDSDPLELEKIENRLDVIYRIKKKYRADIPEILKLAEEIEQKLERNLNIEEELLALKARRKESLRAISAKCNEMSAIRRKEADIVQVQIQEILKELGMKDVEFAISMEKQATFTAAGNDNLEFMISPNLGESLKPLSQIASGGEMSRVMLAMKTIIADNIGTLIFDEIDAGVSGRTAQQVAEKLAHIAKNRQILCITHLPQIAAMADNHFLISKEVANNQTLTQVTELDYRGSIAELARLIGGAEITQTTVIAATEMKDMGLARKKTHCH
ncbi:MAG: DNA repair protein RecN [Turicibacter sp.]|nr:DNA repair protein RecN [Turicibacter sp.]